MTTSKTAGKKPRSSEHAESFEQSVKRLEEIAELLESGNVPLDDAMKIYEEGIQISRRCLEKLSEVELKLKKLSKDVQGNISLLSDREDE